MKQAEREERFNAIVKRIESTPESQAIFAAAKASERGAVLGLGDWVAEEFLMEHELESEKK